MRVLLISLLLCGTAYAAPPTINAGFTFEDPYFGQTVMCDTADEIRSIVKASKPNEEFKKLYETPNSEGSPTCIAASFAAQVLSVEPSGMMTFDSGDQFASWIVEVTGNGSPKSAFVLYLEKAQGI